MNILILSEASYPRHPGGAGKCTHLLAAGLVKRGHTVHILCESHEEEEIEQIHGVNVHRIRVISPGSIPKEKIETYQADKVFTYLQKKLPLSSIDIVHDSGGFLSFFFPAAYKLRQLYNIPLVHHFRYLMLKHHAAKSGGQDYNPFAHTVLWIESCCNETTQCFPVRIADQVICTSTEDKDFVRQIFKPEPHRLAVVPDPVDLNLYSREEGQILRNRLAKPGEKLMLFGGRIDSELKGGDIVYRAFKKILSAYPRLRLVLLSKGEDELARFIREFKSAVTMLGWVRDARELARVFSAVDLVVMPSRYESFGMMCAEAMAAGTPVVASPVGGLRDMITHGWNGFLFSSPDPKSWEHELVRYSLDILSHPVLAGTLGNNAETFARENLSIPGIAERIEQIYTGVISKSQDSTRGLITAPRLSSRDKERYCALLNKMIGPDAGKAGAALLSPWQTSIDQYCLSCTRQRMAADTTRLLSLGRSRLCRLWGRISGTFKKEVQDAVELACPLGLVQKDFFKIKGHLLTKELKTDEDKI